MSVVIAKNKKLYMLRINRRWTQEDAAQRLGIPLATYQLIEQGKQAGKASAWAKIQKVYNIPDADMWEIIKESL